MRFILAIITLSFLAACKPGCDSPNPPSGHVQVCEALLGTGPS